MVFYSMSVLNDLYRDWKSESVWNAISLLLSTLRNSVEMVEWPEKWENHIFSP